MAAQALRSHRGRIERWARSSQRAPGIVLGGWVGGLSFVRSLGRRGIPVLVLDHERSVGTYSRYAEVLCLPSPEVEPQAWIDALGAVGERLQRPGVLFPMSDLHVLLVAEHAERLAGAYRFLVPPLDTLRAVVDKRTQYEAAERAGIPVPRTLYPDGPAAIRSLAQAVTYPCLLKPRSSHTASRRLRGKVAVVGSRRELVDAFERVTRGGGSFLLQEIVPGGDAALFGYLAYWDRDGRELAYITKRKLRQNPPGFGDGSLQVSVDVPEVADLGRRVVKALGCVGYVSVELKRDARDGSYRLMELNPRAVSGNQLAVSAGVDLPHVGYRDLLGEDVPAPAARAGVKYVHELWDLKAFLALRRSGGLRLLPWLRSLRGARARALWAWDDPLPLLATAWRAARARGRTRPERRPLP